MNLIKYLLVVPAFLVSCASTNSKTTSTPAAQTSASEFSIPAPASSKLENGMRILWIEDKTLPYISFQMMLHSGSANDPAGREGLANFTAELLDKGTAKRAATQIADDLAQLGANFDAAADSDYIMLNAGGLSFHKEKILQQYAEIVLSPIFPNAEIERQRKIFTAGMMRLADSAEQFIETLYPQFLYGQHPYGHADMGNLKSIRAIRKVDVQKYYNSEFVPENAVLAVVGKFDEDYKKLVMDAFGKWKSKPAAPLKLPDFPTWSGIQSLLIDRSDLQQAQIEILFKGVPRNMPEFLQLRAALKVLGESFGSRLFDEIRVKRGLTYHISAWFDPRQIAGPMGIYTFTRTDKIGETVNESLNVYREFVKNGVTDREMEDIRALMRGQFPRIFETREAVARQLLVLNRYGVDISYLNDYFKNLNKMTKSDVNATIRKYFDPNNIRIVVYAPKEKAFEALKTLGSVEVKNYRDFLR